MLTVNEKAQDTLIQSITCNFGKSALYSALTALQSSTLNIQKQLNESVDTIEIIFRKMQDECQESFESKHKEELSDGSIVTRGTRDFLKDLMNKLNGETKPMEEEDKEDNVYYKDIVVGASLVADDATLLIMGDNSNICISAKDIPSYSRATAGIQMIKGNQIKSVSKV